MLGFKIPASFGTTLLQRVGSGAAANLAVGTATASAQQAVLESSGNAELAKAYSPSTLRHERSTYLLAPYSAASPTCRPGQGQPVRTGTLC
ncbi:hypothetical protein SNK04_013986 [Fusarium graminearum]